MEEQPAHPALSPCRLSSAQEPLPGGLLRHPSGMWPLHTLSLWQGVRLHLAADRQGLAESTGSSGSPQDPTFENLTELVGSLSGHWTSYLLESF